MAEEKRKFFSKEELKEEIVEKIEEPVKVKETPKKPKKEEKMVMVQVGTDPYDNPSFKFVPEYQLEKFKNEFKL